MEHSFFDRNMSFNPKHKLHVINFVLKMLRESRACGNQPLKNVDDVNIKYFKSLINPLTDFIQAKAVECIFDNLLTSNRVNTNSDGIIILDHLKSNWLSKSNKLSQGSYGTVFRMLFETAEFALKQADDLSLLHYIYIEYFLGSAVLNNLRKWCPTFAYTYGTYNCEMAFATGNLCYEPSGIENRNPPAIIYEFIKGYTVYDLNKVGLNELKVCATTIVQILMALEIAQREYRFCHYDLSSRNVMVTNERHVFSILLGTTEYVFNSPMAKIIDYGFSTAQYDGQTVFSNVLGNFNAPKNKVYRRYGYLVQGFDMIMFLISIYENPSLKMETKTYLWDILTNDLNIPPRSIGKIIDSNKTSYYGDIIDLQAVSTTPSMLLSRLLNDRSATFKILKNSGFLVNSIRRHTLTTSENNIHVINSEAYKPKMPVKTFNIRFTSFLMYSYAMMNRLPVSRNDYTPGELVAMRVEDKKILKFRASQIKADRVTEDMAWNVLRTSIEQYRKGQNRQLITEFMTYSTWVDLIKNYEQIYLMIIVTNLVTDPYLEFSRQYRRFISSINFQTYEGARRWCHTLIESVEYPENEKYFIISPSIIEHAQPPNFSEPLLSPDLPPVSYTRSPDYY